MDKIEIAFKNIIKVTSNLKGQIKSDRRKSDE